jgi:HSP20 family molecular chaperone IbpA
LRSISMDGDNGVLRIHLPKPLEVASKQQKIEIKKG